MGERIKIGIADLNICKSPDSIVTLGLGSCVGIVLYDYRLLLGGMVHIMLPDSTKIRDNTNIAKFADTGIEELVKRMRHHGAVPSRFTAKIAGGAQMFQFAGSDDIMSVGDRNVEAAKAKLKELRIRIIAEDVGENYGRTIEFFPQTGKLLIKAVGKEERYI